MKLLLDENLSRRILPLLEQEYTGSTQVALAGLERADDRTVWAFAKNDNYVLVSKDEDFLGLLQLYGYPPKLIRLSLGNCRNEQVANLLNINKAEISVLLKDPNIGLIELW